MSYEKNHQRTSKVFNGMIHQQKGDTYFTYQQILLSLRVRAFGMVLFFCIIERASFIEPRGLFYF